VPVGFGFSASFICSGAPHWQTWKLRIVVLPHSSGRLVPAIHGFVQGIPIKRWMPGTRPGHGRAAARYRYHHIAEP
jgi:hypothetical protein